MLILNQAKLEEVIDKIKKSRVYCLDTETTGLHPFLGDRIIGISLGVEREGTFETYYAPFRHKLWNPKIEALDTEFQSLKKSQSKANKARKEEIQEQITYLRDEEEEWSKHPYNLSMAEYKPFLEELFGDPSLSCKMWNAIFDVLMVEAEGILFNNNVLEVMLKAHLCNENDVPFELKRHGRIHLGEDEEGEKKALLAWGKRHGMKKEEVYKNLAKVDLETVRIYAEQDVSITHRLDKMLEPRLDLFNLRTIYGEICEYNGIFKEIVAHGILVDKEKAAQYSAYCRMKVSELAHKISRSMPGVSVTSPLQLAKYFGTPNADKERLTMLAEAGREEAQDIIEMRQWERADTSYYRTFLELADPNGRVHPGYKIHGTVAGRPSCQKPNLLNVPRYPKQDNIELAVLTPGMVKDVVHSPPGYSLLSFDLSQAELRMMAHYCEDPMMLDAYQDQSVDRAGRDLHQLTADRLNISRDFSKVVNFGTLYGMQAEGLSKRLKIEKRAAQDILDRRAKEMPQTFIFERQLIRFAERERYILLWTGRRRRYAPWMDCHTALNNLIQGGVAEIMRHIMLRINRRLKTIDEDVRPKMILQVYDDLMFEVRDDFLVEAANIIRPLMEDFDFRVPIIAEGKAGKRWSEMKGLKQ